jgi:hypothetical protein
MNDPLQNRLNMLGACLNLAHSDEYRPIWHSLPPLDFTADMVTLGSLYDSASGLAADIAGAITGTTDDKAAAETVLEDLDYQLARAVFNHCKKTDDPANCAKVNFSKSAIQRLRNQDLIATSTLIRDLAQSFLAVPAAAGRGITAARITALTAALADFAALVNAPRGQIANKTVMVRELETRVAAGVDHITDMDDLVLQLAGTPAGDLFAAAWKQTRMVIDAGHGPGDEPPTP